MCMWNCTEILAVYIKMVVLVKLLTLESVALLKMNIVIGIFQSS